MTALVLLIASALTVLLLEAYFEGWRPLRPRPTRRPQDWRHRR